MLHSYKFIYENMAYITFHGVISADYPQLEEKARASYNNAISWKELNSDDNSQLKTVLNKSVEGGNVATIPLMSDADVKIVDGGFHVTGTVGADKIRIEGEKLWKNDVLLWPEGGVEEEPIQGVEEPAQVAEEPVTEPEQKPAEEEPTPVLVEENTTSVVEYEAEVPPEKPGVVKVAVGFIQGKSVTPAASAPSFNVGFIANTERKAAQAPGKVFGSTEEHFVWCEEYAKDHTPTWKTPVKKEESKKKEEPKKEEPKKQETVKKEAAPKGLPPRGLRRERVIEEVKELHGEETYVGRKAMPALFYEPETEPESKSAPVQETAEDAFDDIFGVADEEEQVQEEAPATWDDLLAKQSDVDANAQDFVPTEPVKEQLRSSVAQESAIADIPIPGFLNDVPRELLGQINSFTTSTIDRDELLSSGVNYCVNNGWSNVGQWFCIDVVSTASRYFYNPVESICEEVSFGLCKEMLRRIEG